ncbi:GNAT family protein [Caballeronia sp. LZ062]|uniref:GNAT family N-acetyltransferase n=1 Tax=unclassified Caballeronia TaxID=2646786 RepID=UPI002864DA56|nr:MULTISPECIES: GNAT family protein [unclassified Caballeronia]MDR5853373.1 GNAT family protein [Caballeronia sp. LZ050]MDR5872092.1 GNAT family protein [Caballeronia sp. LZ062]
MNIFLREIQASDLPAITAWRADREVVDALVGNFRHVNEDVDRRWYDAYLASRANNVRLAICLRESGECVGVVYLLQIHWINRTGEFGIQIGDAAARGRGIGEAATRLMLRHAFADLNLRRVSLSVLADNTRAIRLYERVGFRHEGVQREAVFKGGRYVDLLMMATLADDQDAQQ